MQDYNPLPLSDDKVRATSIILAFGAYLRTNWITHYKFDIKKASRDGDASLLATPRIPFKPIVNSRGGHAQSLLMIALPVIVPGSENGDRAKQSVCMLYVYSGFDLVTTSQGLPWLTHIPLRMADKIFRFERNSDILDLDRCEKIHSLLHDISNRRYPHRPEVRDGTHKSREQRQLGALLRPKTP